MLLQGSTFPSVENIFVLKLNLVLVQVFIELPTRPAKRETRGREGPAAAVVDAAAGVDSGDVAAEGARMTGWVRASGGRRTGGSGVPIVIE